jgi:hypothetical protein
MMARAPTRLIVTAVGLLLASAVYLIAVRGPGMIVDMATMVVGAFCL